MPRISQLPALTTADNGDELAINDISASVTKKITRADLLKGPLPTNAVTTAAITAGSVTPEKLIAGAGTSWNWQSYTPVISNFTIGNGTISAKYTKIGKTIDVQGRVTFGTTTAITGKLIISLPTPAIASTYSTRETMGVGHVVHPASGQHTSVFCIYDTVSTITLAIPTTVGGTNPVFTETGPSREITAGTPWVWASTDVFSWHLTYESAA